MSRLRTLLTAAPLALAATVAQADSAASATLSFLVQATPGFAWVNDPGLPSFAEADVNAADFEAWVPAAGTFVPAFGTGGTGFDLATGAGLLSSAANASGDDTFASALSFGDAAQRLGVVSAAAIVPIAGSASATAFQRAWFELAPGASVTFRGGATLAVSGSNLAFPASYVTVDFYGFATALLAVGSDEQSFELGGPAATGAVGSYALSDIGQFLFTVTNSGSEPYFNFLDAGVSVYSASVVPEPGSYALLLAGLGVIGFVAARRRA